MLLFFFLYWKFLVQQNMFIPNEKRGNKNICTVYCNVKTIEFKEKEKKKTPTRLRSG